MLKSTLYQCFKIQLKRQLKTPICFGSFMIHPQGLLKNTGPKITLPNTDYAHKNITSNFSQGRSTIPEDGSQRIPIRR